MLGLIKENINLFLPSIIITIVISYAPFTGRFFGFLDTLLHEAGHAIACLITFQKPHSIKIFWNQEGLTESSYQLNLRGWVSRIVSLISGYPSGVFWGSLLIIAPLFLDFRIVLVMFLLMGLMVIILSRTILTFLLSIFFVSAVYLTYILGDSVQYSGELNNIIRITLGLTIIFNSYKSLVTLTRLVLFQPMIDNDVVFLQKVLWLPRPVLLLIYWILSLITPLWVYQGLEKISTIL